MLLDYLQEVTFWHWWIAALAIGTMEMILPGVLFLWLAIAATVVGFLLLAIPDLSWENQIIIFAVLGVISAVAGRVIYKRDPGISDHPTLNKKGAQYVGQVYTLEETMTGGRGRVRIGDTVWGVEGEGDLPAGTKVKITGLSGTNMIVEQVTKS